MEQAYYYEEEVAVQSEEVLGASFLTRLGQWLFVLFAFLFPLFILPATILPVEMNKGYLAAFAAFILLATWLGGALQEGKLRFSKSWALVAYGVFLVLWLVATLLSKSFFLSFFGRGSEVTSFFAFLVGGIFLVVIPGLLSSRAVIMRALASLVLSFCIVSALFIARAIVNINVFGLLAANRYFNLIGSWTMVGAFFTFFSTLLLPFFGIKKSLVRTVAIILWVLSFLLLAATNFTFGIIEVGLAALILLALFLSQRKTHSTLFGVTLGILLLCTLLILLRAPLQRLVANPLGAPAEVRPDWPSTIDIVQKSIGDSLLFGNGPNTFDSLWDKYKPADINKTPFWALRFDAGVASVPTMFAEGGVLGIGSFLLFCVFLIGLLFQALGVSLDNELFEASLRGLTLGVLALLLLWFVYPVNSTLAILSFMAIGLFFAMAQHSELISSGELNLFSSTERGFVGSLAIILLLIGSVVGIYYESLRYASQVLYAKAIDDFNKGAGYNTARARLLDAASYDASQDYYWRSLAELEITSLNKILNTQGGDPKELQDRFRSTLASAVDEGKHATDAGPLDENNWSTLGRVYKTATVVVPSSADFALDNFKKAHELAPSDPLVFVEIAQTHLAAASAALLQNQGKDPNGTVAAERSEAIKALVSATALKEDFTEAHFLLAQLYAQEGKSDEAISRAQQAYQLSPNDVGILFQLGFLYYQKNDFANAQAAFRQAVKINPNYSNALYFLGLIYDHDGRHDDALAIFKKIANINPDNQEVGKIIANLSAGKPALTQITPVQNRKELPVSDKKQ